MLIWVTVGWWYCNARRYCKLTWWQRKAGTALRLNIALPLVLNGNIAAPCQQIVIIRHETFGDAEWASLRSTEGCRSRDVPVRVPAYFSTVSKFIHETVHWGKTYAMVTWHGRVR